MDLTTEALSPHPRVPAPRVVSLLASSNTMATDDVLAITGRADELYRQRAQPGAVRESVMVLSGSRNGSGRYEIQWRLARALFFLGQQAKTTSEKQQLFAAGIGAGERAIALNAERVEGHFWTGVNLALFAESGGGLRAARALRWALKELRLAAMINERYHDAGPLRVLARLYHKAPRLLGGNRRYSREHFERAIEIAPANSVTMIYAAEYFIDAGETNRARSLLEKVIAGRIDEEWEFEHRRDKELAKAMLERLR